MSARAANRPLMRDDTTIASSSAASAVPAAVVRNRESALRSSVLSGVRGWVTSQACLQRSSRGESDALRLRGNHGNLERGDYRILGVRHQRSTRQLASG